MARHCSVHDLMFDKHAGCPSCNDVTAEYIKSKNAAASSVYIDNISIEHADEIKNLIVFPLTRDEVDLLLSELRPHVFSRHHPHYLYAHSLLDRMGRWLEDRIFKLEKGDKV